VPRRRPAGRECLDRFADLQQSDPDSIDGTVSFSTQAYADDYQANGYQPHVEPWDYAFHGYLSNPFQVAGLPVPHTMVAGSVVSFLWWWSKLPKYHAGGYAYVNCTYSPLVHQRRSPGGGQTGWSWSGR
jgi:hypothetical protein